MQVNQNIYMFINMHCVEPHSRFDSFIYCIQASEDRSP